MRTRCAATRTFIVVALATAGMPGVGLAADPTKSPATSARGSVTTLRNETLGFSLDYPSEWKPTQLFVSKGPNKPIVDFDFSMNAAPAAPESWVGVWFNFQPYGTPALPSFSVTAQERPPYTFDEFVKELTPVLEKGGAKVVTARKVKVGGKIAYEVVYSVGESIWQRIITVPYGKRRLVIAQHRTPKATYEQFDPAIQKVLSSVRFE